MSKAYSIKELCIGKEPYVLVISSLLRCEVFNLAPAGLYWLHLHERHIQYILQFLDQFFMYISFVFVLVIGPSVLVKHTNSFMSFSFAFFCINHYHDQTINP